ncbi:type I restriction endonuclease subunit R [Clostridium sp. UBA3061]|uniref:type I restriction endonuclease subunit R n=1 Tax=Clostridium sp. UBA3061 TaxID=1946353 RepID=UPI00321745D4
MLNLNDLRERNYQDIIKEYLINENGYINGFNKDYDKIYAIDRKMLFEFLYDTQGAQMEKLKEIYKENLEEKIIERLNKEISDYGILEVLKNGFKDRGQRLYFLFRKPETIYNREAIELYNKNRFSVTEEVVYNEYDFQGDVHNKKGRIDLVIFLNGIPIITFELKNNISGQSVKNAKIQYMNDRSPSEKLFTFNERCIVHFAMDTEEVYMTTKLNKQNTLFLPFNKGNQGGKGNPYVEGKLKVHYMWEDILTKDTLLYLIDKFVYLQVKEENNKKPKKNIIFPRYHQIDVVRSLLDDVYKNKTKFNYLIQHSAGSGKTNSIAWLSHRLMSIHDEDNKNIFDVVIVMTDRKVVDKQLRDAVLGLPHKAGSIKIMDRDSDQLAHGLMDSTKILVTTIQKFRYILDKINVIKNKNFAIIIDEAHSSTSGRNMEAVTKALSMDEESYSPEEIDLEDEIMDEIKRNGKQDNISMFAFTATPKPATLDMFGVEVPGSERKEAFHLYSMKQAIEEGFILDVLKNYVTYKTYFEVRQIVDQDPNLPKTKTKRKIAKCRDLHPTNISQKVGIIIEHFKENVMHKIGGRAKAMVITSSRESAVRYKFAFEKYVKENGYENIKALVAFSGKVSLDEFGEELTEEKINGFKEEELPERFAEDYQVLLVADKYQTGFDQPLLHTMYIDKKLRGVKAVQTLSRLNRTCSGKDDTFILDFKNDLEDIKKAFSTFYECTELIESLDPNLVYDLERKIENFNIINREEIEKFIKKAYKEDKTSKDRQQQISYVSKALERVKRYNDEDVILIRATLRKFTNFYSLMIQISDFEDVELHKLYIFAKFLVKAIEVGSDVDIDISDKVSLENFRQVKVGEEKSTKIDANGDIKHNTSINVTSMDEEFDALSHIVKELNTLFNLNLGETETLALMQVQKLLKSSEDLKRRANNNTIDNFRYSFNDAFEKSIMDGFSKNKTFFETLLTNEKVSTILMEFMADRVYNQLRK